MHTDFANILKDLGSQTYESGRLATSLLSAHITLLEEELSQQKSLIEKRVRQTFLFGITSAFCLGFLSLSLVHLLIEADIIAHYSLAYAAVAAGWFFLSALFAWKMRGSTSKISFFPKQTYQSFRESLVCLKNELH